MTTDEMTQPTPRVKAVTAPGALLVEHCDVPADMTLCEWRRATSSERPPRRRPLLQRVFGRAA